MKMTNEDDQVKAMLEYRKKLQNKSSRKNTEFIANKHVIKEGIKNGLSLSECWKFLSSDENKGVKLTMTYQTFLNIFKRVFGDPEKIKREYTASTKPLSDK